MNGKTQVWPAAGPESTEQVEGASVVVQVRVVHTGSPEGLHTHVLQSCWKVVPGVQTVGADVVVVVVLVVVVVVVVTEETVVVVVEEVVVVVVVAAEVSVGQVEGQKPYSPSIWVPAVVVEVLHHAADWPTLVQEL